MKYLIWKYIRIKEYFKKSYLFINCERKNWYTSNFLQSLCVDRLVPWNNHIVHEGTGSSWVGRCNCYDDAHTMQSIFSVNSTSVVVCIIRNMLYEGLANQSLEHSVCVLSNCPSSSDHPLDIHWTYWRYALISKIISNGYPVTIRMSCLMTIFSGYWCNRLFLSRKRFASTAVWTSYLRLVSPPC